MDQSRCPQYDDDIFLEINIRERNAIQSCYKKKITYGILIEDINYLDNRLLKRESASFESNYNFEDTIIKSPIPRFPDSSGTSIIGYNPIWTPFEIDSSKMEKTPFARAANYTYVQINDPIKSYETLFFNCIDKSSSEMSLEEYLAELNKIIKDREDAINQKIKYCYKLLYFIKDTEKDKIELPYKKGDLLAACESTQKEYYKTKNAFDALKSDEKNIEYTYSTLEKERMYYIDELKEAIIILQRLGVPEKDFRMASPQEADKKEKEEREKEKAEKERDEKEKEAMSRKQLQDRDPAILQQIQTSPTYLGKALKIGSFLVDVTRYTIKGIWYATNTIAIGVTKTWEMAKDIKGFIEDKPAQILLAKLLYTELDDKIRDLQKHMSRIKEILDKSRADVAAVSTRGLDTKYVNDLRKAMLIAVERYRRFEQIREYRVAGTMRSTLLKMKNEIYDSINFTNNKHIAALNLIIQFPTGFSSLSFPKANISNNITEKDINIENPPLIPYVQECDTVFIIPSFEDYIRLFNQGSWRDLYC